MFRSNISLNNGVQFYKHSSIQITVQRPDGRKFSVLYFEKLEYVFIYIYYIYVYVKEVFASMRVARSVTDSTGQHVFMQYHHEITCALLKLK